MAKRGPKPKEGGGRRKPTGRGKRGPAKTPVAKLKLHNSRLAKDRIKPCEIINFPAELPERPAWCTGERRKIWDRLIELYRRDYKGLVGLLDVYVLARYCDLLAWYLKLRKDVGIEGEIKTLYNKAGNKYLSSNPKAKLALQIASQLNKLEAEMYLTPAARQGLIMEKKPAEENPDSLAAFLKRNKNTA